MTDTAESEEPTLTEEAEVARSLGSLPAAKDFIRDVRRRERERMESAAPDLRDALKALLRFVEGIDPSNLDSDKPLTRVATQRMDLIVEAREALEDAGVET